MREEELVDRLLILVRGKIQKFKRSILDGHCTSHRSLSQ